jgi:CheY-like chemotaxis protein
VGQKLILLVDDDRDTIDLYEVFFRGIGHATVSAPDGESALRAVHVRRPDMVILDIGLPGMSGVDVLRALRAEEDTRHLPVLVLTAQVLPHEIARLGELACDGILAKPCELAELFGAVSWLLDAARPSAERMQLAPPPFRRPRVERRSRTAAARRRDMDLMALCQWSDFLQRESQGLLETSAALMTRSRSLQLRLFVTRAGRARDS